METGDKFKVYRTYLKNSTFKHNNIMLSKCINYESSEYSSTSFHTLKVLSDEAEITLC